VSACGGDDGEVGLFTGESAGSAGEATAADTAASSAGSTSDDGLTQGDSSSDESSDSTSDPSSSDDGILDVVAGDGTSTGTGSELCGVDILFIVDNSLSMDVHKEGIVAGFDGFVNEMTDALEPGTPVHIGVTRGTGFFNPGNGSGWGGGACEFSYLDGEWTPPDVMMNGENGHQGRLYEHEGQTYGEYATDEDPTAIKGWFEGALGGAIANASFSNSETVVAAATYPFHPANATHNAGFLRDKAVLVLFLISDAPDAAPVSVTTQSMIDLVSDAKAACGDECILPAGVIPGGCYETAENTNTRLTDFMNGFPAPPALDFFTGTTAPSTFSDVLGAALADSIAYTCDEFVPID
jgi:hypothetical protein